MARRAPVYMDYNAGAPLHPEARRFLESEILPFGPHNASSLHSFGRIAKGRLEKSRRALAASIGATPAHRVVFTSGGTEANNMAMRCFGWETIVVGATEHPSVRAAAECGAKRVLVLPSDEQGRISLEALEEALRQAEGATLVSVMAANNETGAVCDVPPLAEIAKKHGAFFHTDASQAYGKIAFSMKECGADMATLSAHKIGGLPGAGALVYPAGMTPAPLVAGGGQEFRARSGTENVPAVAVFGHMAERIDEVRAEFFACAPLRDAMERHIKEIGGDSVYVFAEKTPRLPNTSCFATRGAASDTQLAHFDLDGFAVSNGSACSSGTATPGAALSSMRKDLAPFAVRVSLGSGVRESDVNAMCDSWKKYFFRIR
ncbi:MAG: cysteine desulfurase family protein [Rickettsiales bacterium]